MKTDIPLKRLIQRRPADLLPLLGAAFAEVLEVETLELPASATRLDTLLRLRTPQHAPYLHLIEWQGYPDPRILWRVMSYLAWLGLHRDEHPIRATVVYLRPEDDMGDTLMQQDGPSAKGDWQLQFSVVRVWEQDAQAALAAGVPGLLALMPLMHGATAAMVEQAAKQLISSLTPPAQGDILVALGVFAEPLISSERFIRLVRKERLMASDLISYLLQDAVQEKLAELQAQFREQAAELEQKKTTLEQEKTTLEQEKTTLEQEKTTLEQELQASVASLQASAVEAVRVRFPALAPEMAQRVAQVTDPSMLQQVIMGVLRADNQAVVEHVLAALPAAPAT